MATFPSPAMGLDTLLSSVARGVVSAQRDLDQAALTAPETTVTLAGDELRLRPLWFVFGQAVLELEISTVDCSGATLTCRPLDPLSVALRGRTASASAKVRVTIEPLGAALLRRRE